MESHEEGKMDVKRGKLGQSGQARTHENSLKSRRSLTSRKPSTLMMESSAGKAGILSPRH